MTQIGDSRRRLGDELARTAADVRRRMESWRRALAYAVEAGGVDGAEPVGFEDIGDGPLMTEIEIADDGTVTWKGSGEPVDFDALEREGRVRRLFTCPACGGETPYETKEDV